MELSNEQKEFNSKLDAWCWKFEELEGSWLFWLIFIGTAVLIFCFPWGVLTGVVLLTIVIMKRGFIMEAVDKLKGLLGSGDEKTQMKLEALAKHLKVKLVHVPEHFTCKSIEQKPGKLEKMEYIEEGE